MSIASQKNIGAFVHAAIASAYTALTAGGSGNGTQVTGVSIDRQAQNLPLSASVLYAISATVANTKTLSLAYSVQHSVDNSTWVDFNDTSNQVTTTVEINGNSGGTLQTLLIKQDVDLNGANQYVRIQFTPTLSNTSTDTANVFPMFVFGGMDILP